MDATNGEAEKKQTATTAVTRAMWVLLAVLPIALLSLFAFRIASGVVKESSHRGNLAAAVVAADLVSDGFQRSLSLTTSLAESPGLVRGVRARDGDVVRKHLHSTVSAFPAIDRSLIVDTEGVLWVDYPPSPELLGRSFVHRDWYAGVSREWTPYISDVYVRDSEPRVLVVSVAAPVRDEEGEVISIVVTQHRVDSISENLRHVRWGETGVVFLLDSNGHVAGHPELDLERLYDEYVNLEPVQNALAGVSYTGEFSNPVDGRETVATFYPLRRRNWVVVAQQATAEAYAPIRRIAWNIGGTGAILAVVVASVVIGLWRASENNRHLSLELAGRTAALEEQTKRQRSLSTQLISVEQRERKRLAALLHDDLQQLLVAADMRLNSISEDVLDRSIKERLREVGDWIDRALKSARDLTHELRPPVLYEADLVAALHWLASRVWDRHQVQVEIKGEGPLQPLRNEIKALLFDCVRELLFNVVKHAGVARVTVSIFEVGDSLCVTVEDKGKGFDVEGAKDLRNGGFGLFNISERLSALGGNMTIHSRIDQGTRTKLTIPLAMAVAAKRAVISEGEFSKGPVHPEAPLVDTAAPGSIRVLVVDDHVLVRQGIANILSSEERISVVGEAADGMEAIEAVERLSPEVMLVDLNMPRMNGIEATREIHRRWPNKIVIGLSVQDDEATRNSMLNAGARAFLSKSGDAENMITTILKLKDEDIQKS